MKKENITQEESLELIREMVSLSRHKLSESGFHFLLWGILVGTAALVQYALIAAGFGPESNWVWVVMPLIGVPAAVIYEYRRQRAARVKTKFDGIYASVWTGFGIALFLIIPISIIMQANPIPFILVLVGLATFVSGAVVRFRPLSIGAGVFWLTAVLSLWLGDADLLLAYAGAVFLGYVIPGLLLRKRFKAEQSV